MGCNILLEGGGRILLEDGASALLQDGCLTLPLTGCEILLEDGTQILEEDGLTPINLETCPGTSTTPGGGFAISVRRRQRVVGLTVPLTDEEDEAVALALLEALRDRRRLSG